MNTEPQTADDWWENLSPARRDQIFRFLGPPVSAPEPGRDQISILDYLERKQG